MLRQPTLELRGFLPLITASLPVTTITFVVAPLCANRGAGRKGLNFRVKGGRRQMFFFFYLLQKKKVTVVLLNDYVLKPPPKYLCLCLSIRAALSLFAVTTLNVETHNSSKHRKQVTTEGP